MSEIETAIAKDENGPKSVMKNVEYLDKLANLIKVTQTAYKTKSTKTVQTSLKILSKALEKCEEEDSDNLVDAGIVSSLLVFLKEFAGAKFDTKPIVLDALVSLHFALPYGIEVLNSTITDYFSVIPSLIDYRYDTTLAVQIYTMKCLKELGLKVSSSPLQTQPAFDSLKDPLIYESLASCLDYKVIKTEKKFVTHLSTTSAKALAELMHPTDGDVFQFPCVFQSESSSSTENIDCNQDINIRTAIAKALAKQNIVSSLSDLVNSPDYNSRIGILKVLFQSCRFLPEFARQVALDSPLVSSIMSLVKDSTDMKVIYETELSCLLLATVFKETPKIIPQFGRDIDTVINTSVSIINTALDERYKCFAILLLARLSSNPDSKKRVISELMTPVGMSKLNDVLTKDVS